MYMRERDRERTKEMRRSIYLNVLATFLFFFQLLSASSSASTGDLGKMCYILQGYYIQVPHCNEFFAHDSRSQNATSKELAVISIDIVTADVVALKSKIASELKKEKDPSVKVRLELCSKNVTDGDSLLKQAKIDAMSQNFSKSFVELQNYADFPAKCNEVEGKFVNPIYNETHAVVDGALIARSVSDAADKFF